MHCKKLSFQIQLFVCLLALVAVRCIYAADPLQFVRVQEDMGPGRIHDLHTPGQVSQILRADANSTLRITIDPTALGTDAALNRIRMSASLAQTNGSAKPVNVEIVGYSQIDVAPNSQSSQNAAAFETADQIQSDISSLYFTTSDLIQTIYGAGSDCVQNPRHTHCADLSTVAGNRDTISNRLALFRPEILRIAEDVADPNKAALIQLVSASIFGLTPATILDIRTQLETDLITALDPQKKDDQRDAALEELAQRVRLMWIDLQEISSRIGTLQTARPDLSTQAAATQVFAELFQQELVVLKSQLVTGTIDLPSYKAAAGDVLTLTIEAGSPTSFHIEIGNYHIQAHVVDSAFFIRRFRDVPSQRVNFMPAAGVTYGPTFYSRPDQSRWSRFRAAVAPGMGLSVCLMNFPDYDPLTGVVQTTTSPVQVGAGFVASVFAGAIQFTYGWNLNVSSGRQYWGVGFSFISLAHALGLGASKSGQ